MEYSLLDQDDTKRVVFYGNLRASARSKIVEIIDAMPTIDQKKWTLDVTDFEYIDSAGLGMLIEIQENAKKHGISISIMGANGLVKRMFDLSKFDTLFDIID